MSDEYICFKCKKECNIHDTTDDGYFTICTCKHCGARNCVRGDKN